ncbi:hypothetical protein TELCIR_07836 [Teladorsagia circumcincta]|uniref:Myosin motor domain-containing protein n=1 Tax=Teladorsagia circumcincta TaxID=45464 RepID=A0A2G9UJA0_TELCI|nr:hypothetical protein TELCIR_07836 [Teladorsagia circumcincta]
MLDEECIVPKANDMTYVDKLNNQHLGKHPNFQKDPLNDSAVAVLKTCDKNSLIHQIWEDYITDVDREEYASRDIQDGFGPINHCKQVEGMVDIGDIRSMLTCNGVLEGIRICRKGFPNRMTFADFRFRYAILAADEAAGNDMAEASKKMLERLVKENKIKDDNFMVGASKVFFRTGIVARMEELRDAALAKVIIKFQCAVRCYLAQVCR